MHYNNLIIDVNNLYFRAYNGFDFKTTTYKGRIIQVQGIEGSLLMINKIIREYMKPNGRIYFLFDNPTSRDKHRKMLNPEYKSNRENLPVSFFRGLDYLELILKNYRDDTFIVRQKETEADDWVLPIVENNRRKEDETFLMVSTDLDWARSLSETVHWLDKKKLVTPEIFVAEYGFYPTVESVCFYKTFYGDKVDNIKPTIKQLSMKAFGEVIEKAESIYQFLELVEARKLSWVDDGWVRRIMTTEREALIENWRLVNFLPLTGADLKKRTFICEFKQSKLTILYNIFGIGGFDKRVQSPKVKPVMDSLLGGEKIKRK